MNNPFAYQPDAECDRVFGVLLERIEEMKLSGRPEDINFCRELEEGKMLGVLIAEDKDGTRHTLYAFSGQLGEGGFHHAGFVEPVIDYLGPGSYFKRHETKISLINTEINKFMTGPLAKINSEYEHAVAKSEEELSSYKEYCRRSKASRDIRRQKGNLSDLEAADMIRLSQFEKAELHRLKKRLRAETAPFANRLQEAHEYLERLKEKRRKGSESLQEWLFSNFRVLNARGESKSLHEIFAETPIGVPPSGAGECCAPKLLQAAYVRGWTPVSIAEYWYGKPKDGEIRMHGQCYPACRGKCLPVLGWMLQGLTIDPPLESRETNVIIPEPEILYENEWFCVVNKPSGMLSVPGKGKMVSVQEWLQKKFSTRQQIKVAHRLDQDTSGLLIATFGDKAYKEMQALFAQRKIAKTYIADLEGDYRYSGLCQRGRIDLPLAPDRLDRPRQRLDQANGKQAITDYEFISASQGLSRVIFRPHTGRTHQLRVHAASSQGLGMPIAGDRLYGHTTTKLSYTTNSADFASVRDCCVNNPATPRLHLHAHQISFISPFDGETYTFISPVPF